MKRFALGLTVLALVCALTATARAQYDTPEEILKAAPTPAEFPNAATVKMLDYAELVIDPDGTNTYVTHNITKIMNDRGKGVANIQLPYNSSYQTIEITKARTILPDGTVFDVKPEDMQEITPYAGFNLYSDVKVKAFAMPAVAPECIVDYEWKIVSKDPPFPHQFWTGWMMQETQPILLSKLVVKTPADASFSVSKHRTQIEPEVTEEEGRKTYVWESKAPEEVVPEPLMPPLSEVIPWFQISSVESWDDIAAWFWGLARQELDADQAIKDTVARVTEGAESVEEKAKRLYYWTEDNVRYVGLELGLSAYKPHQASEVFKNKYGDCKDQSALLVTMLAEAGIPSELTLIKAGSVVPIDKGLPFPGQFNHCIVHTMIDGKDVWLDPTAETCSWGDIPPVIAGRDAFVIKEGKGAFVETPPPLPTENATFAKGSIELSSDGSIVATIVNKTVGAADMEARQAYKYTRPDKIKEAFQAAANYISAEAELVDWKLSDFANKDVPVEIQYTLKAPNWATTAGDYMFFMPRVHQGSTGGGGNPFTAQERKYPFWFTTASDLTYDLVIEIPDEYEVAEPVPDMDIHNKFADITRQMTVEGNAIKIHATTRYRPAELPVEAYPEVKGFFAEMAQRYRDQVVLKKKP
jgi:hypothetical protein